MYIHRYTHTYTNSGTRFSQRACDSKLLSGEASLHSLFEEGTSLQCRAAEEPGSPVSTDADRKGSLTDAHVSSLAVNKYWYSPNEKSIEMKPEE